MSRRKIHWREAFRRSGRNLDKILPVSAKGTGEWLKDHESNRNHERSIGKTVTKPIGQKKEALIRKWTHEWDSK